MNLDAVLERAAHARPGYTLAAFKEAALPVYLLTARILVEERKPLGPIEEGCLRAVDAGLTCPEDIASFLGMSMSVLTGVLAALNARECISYARATGDSSAKVSLTEKGRLSLAEARTIVPQELSEKLVFDAYLRRVIFVSTNALSTPKEVKEFGWVELPTCGVKAPDKEDVSLQELDRVIEKLRARDEAPRSLLALRRIERKSLRFLPCVLLFYKSNDGEGVQLAFYRDEGFSPEHENAFRDLGGPDQVGARHALSPAVLPEVSGLASEALAADLAHLGGDVGAVGHSPDERHVVEAIAGEQPSTPAALSKRRAMTQRLVRCHEHPGLLRTALTTSRNRLLIVSPWIRHQVIDRNFYMSLEALLRNGVEIFIGYGLTDEEGAPGNDRATQKPAITAQAQRDLEELQRRFENFSLRFVGNTHRKHLVSDDKFAVVTSFNWLSFRGDPRHKARDELGFLVTEPDDVEGLFEDGMKLLQQGYDHPRQSRPRGATIAARR